MSDYILVHTSIDSKEVADKIADAVVEQRLAACCWVVGPFETRYWWQGKIDHATEWTCQMKTRVDLYDGLEKTIKALHTYEEPEIIATPIVVGSQSYLQWIDSETGKELH